MGYHTDFYGEFTINPALTGEHEKYLIAFSRTRRMARDPKVLASMSDPLREAVGLPIGYEGAFYVNSFYDESSYRGQGDDPSVLDHNSPPHGQPGLWCQWIPGLDADTLEWDQGEKFYFYIEWLVYMVNSFFNPWGYTLEGEVWWQGEEPDDFGKLICTPDAGKTSISVEWGQRSFSTQERVT